MNDTTTKAPTACESCLMPFSQDTGVRENPRYCSLCYKDGKLCYEGDLKGFKKVAYEGMCKRGIGPVRASFYAWMIGFAPRWRGKK